MKLRKFGSNQTILELDNAEVFFSYETPVAAFVEGRGYIRTDCRWSKTTTRHINAYLHLANGGNVTVVPQAELDALIEREAA